MFYWIYDIPSWQLALLFAVVVIGFTWLGIILSRPWIRRWLGPQPGCNDILGYFLSAYGVFYGLMLGLIAVGTYQNFSDVDKIVEREAAVLGALYRDVSSYPEPIRAELQGLLRDYCRHVIEVGWPAQRQGIIPEGGTARITAFQKKLLSFQPTSKAQEILHAETIRQFNVYVEPRRQRLQSVTTGLPATLWYVVVVGAFLNILLTWLFSIDKLSIHLVLAGILSLFIGLMMFLIAKMDNPLRGDFSNSPEAFELIYRSLMTPNPGPPS